MTIAKGERTDVSLTWISFTDPHSSLQNRSHNHKQLRGLTAASAHGKLVIFGLDLPWTFSYRPMYAFAIRTPLYISSSTYRVP